MTLGKLVKFYNLGNLNQDQIADLVGSKPRTLETWSKTKKLLISNALMGLRAFILFGDINEMEKAANIYKAMKGVSSND